MDDTMDRYIGQLLDNRYEILEVIGSGGMAVVYKALCHRLNRHVAVKILRDDLAQDEEFKLRFRTESRAVAMLSHPNIVSVYDVSHTPDLEYIVMELIDGITLKQYMKKRGVLGWKEALHFATQIAKALSHAHGRGLVHRDIKPQNIMVVKDGSVKVADFGIAHLQNEMPVRSGETMGSVHYISPEQARGGPIDARSDIYSLGVVMYEMLSGRLPFEGEAAEAVALMHLSAVPTPLEELNPDIPRELVDITMKAMSADVNARYQSADELLKELEEFRKAKVAAVAGLAAAGERAKGMAVWGVMPLSTSGELSRESYIRRRRRSRKVSMLSGFFGVLLFIVVLLTFLWSYWLKELFSPAERIEVPRFIDSDYEAVINNSEFKSIFNFTVVYDIDPNVKEGIIIDQSPEPGKSLMLVEEGIDVELTVSTGVKMTEIPDLINTEYREATIELQKLGFVVADPVFVSSDTVTKDYVISINPEPGESLPAGSTVYISVSAGPEIKTVKMPYLIGLSRSAAAAECERLNLNLISVIGVENEAKPGTIIGQNIPAGTEVEEHTKVYLQVSTGPKETPSPSPSPTEPPPPPATEPPPPPPPDDGGAQPDTEVGD